MHDVTVEIVRQMKLILRFEYSSSGIFVELYE